MNHEQHRRGLGHRLFLVAVTVLIGGFFVVWGWNSVAAQMLGRAAIDYRQAIAAELAIAALAALVTVVAGGTWHTRDRAPRAVANSPHMHDNG